MDSTQIGVASGGVAAIVLVLWYFFGKREQVAAEVGQSGVQEISVTVKGGYSPDVIAVRRGLPVRLNFYRDETASCSERVIFGDFGIARDLPAFKTTPIEFTPSLSGVNSIGVVLNAGKSRAIPKSPKMTRSLHEAVSSR